MKNEIAFLSIAKELALANFGFASLVGSVVPKAFKFIYLTTSLGVMAANTSML
jgi:hypothetical protein